MATNLMTTEKGFRLVRKSLKMFGYKTSNPNHKNSNGVDLYAFKGNKVLSVEVKSATNPTFNNSVFRVRRVEASRKRDDLIAIYFPNGYVMIEPMKDHLKLCNKTGDRFITI